MYAIRSYYVHCIGLTGDAATIDMYGDVILGAILTGSRKRRQN